MAKRKTRSPRDLMTPAALHILISLAREDLHGYGIKHAVEERTAGALRLGPGTLYEAIHRMEADGWIAEVEDASEPRRRTYRLTPSGRRAMDDELRRLDAIVRFARGHELMPQG